MTYQLYYADGSASMGIRTMLEEIGADYTLIDTTIDMDKPRPADQLAINPNGWIPVLLWEGGAMYEAAAITIFLTDRHPEAHLGPAVGAADRPLFLQTLVYFSSSVQTAFQMTYYPFRFVDSAADEPSVKRHSESRLRDMLGVVDDQIGAKTWVLGDRFSALDIYLTMLTTWMVPPEEGHPPLSDFQNVARIVAAAMERPSVQRVYGPHAS